MQLGVLMATVRKIKKENIPSVCIPTLAPSLTNLINL